MIHRTTIFEEFEMNIGEPKRIYRVEPVKDPVPAKQPKQRPKRPVREKTGAVPA